MHLASIRHDNRGRVVVAFDDAHVIDIDFLLDRPAIDMQALIESGPALLEQLDNALRAFRSGVDESRLIPINEVSWRPPIPRPGKICGVAMNNSASNARKIKAPDHPAFFLKPASCLIGHCQPIRIYDYYGSTHPEPELAVVIGRSTRGISIPRAMDAVFGYTIFNDVTSNGMRAEDLFHYYALYPSKDDPAALERVEQHLSYAGRYKGSDTFGPMGPWIVTRDEVRDPHDLNVSCRVSGEIVAEDSTRYYNYGVAEVISFISRFQTLEAGDVVSMGTAFKTSDSSRRSIHHANLAATAGPVEISIDGLGTLVNPVEFVTTK